MINIENVNIENVINGLECYMAMRRGEKVECKTL